VKKIKKKKKKTKQNELTETFGIQLNEQKPLFFTALLCCGVSSERNPSKMPANLQCSEERLKKKKKETKQQ
jgi:hypothetical protein